VLKAVQTATIALTVRSLLFSRVKSESPYCRAYTKVYQLHLNTTPALLTFADVSRISLQNTQQDL